MALGLGVQVRDDPAANRPRASGSDQVGVLAALRPGDVVAAPDPPRQHSEGQRTCQPDKQSEETGQAPDQQEGYLEEGKPAESSPNHGQGV